MISNSWLDFGVGPDHGTDRKFLRVFPLGNMGVAEL